MPDKKKNEAKSGEVVGREKPEETTVKESLQAGMMTIFGDHDPYKPTKQQVDKILSLNEKAMDYTHAERTMYQPKKVMELIAFIAVLVFVGGLFLCVVWKVPEYTGEAVASIIGLLGGGGVGYGVGSRKKESSDE